MDGSKFDMAPAKAGEVSSSPKKKKVLAIPVLYTCMQKLKFR